MTEAGPAAAVPLACWPAGAAAVAAPAAGPPPLDLPLPEGEGRHHGLQQRQRHPQGGPPPPAAALLVDAASAVPALWLAAAARGFCGGVQPALANFLNPSPGPPRVGYFRASRAE